MVEAFGRAFSGRLDVRLIHKHNAPIFPVPLGIPQVEYIHALYRKEQMRDLLFAADCLVFPIRGEGFGTPRLEAMASGLATIVTGWSGPVDYSDPSDTLILDYRMTPATEFDYRYRDRSDRTYHVGSLAHQHVKYF